MARRRVLFETTLTVCAAAAASFTPSSVVRLRHFRSLVLPRINAASTTQLLACAISQDSNNNNIVNSAAPTMISTSGSFREKLGLSPTPSSPFSITTASRPLVIGHRGSLYQAAENTRRSFQCCLEMGCDGFELDVYVIADGTLVVFHGNDSPGLRLGDFTEYCLVPEEGTRASSATSIVDLTFEECQQELRFNPDFAEFACPKECIVEGRITTLEEILNDVQQHNRNNNHHKVVVKIELKGSNTVVPVLELVERLDMVQDCCYSSFDLSQLKQLRELRPSRELYPTGALFADLPDDFLQQALDAGATEIHLRYDDCTPSRIADIHQRGFGTMAWTRGPRGMHSDCTTRYTTDVGNEDERMYQALLETGVQQLCVNKPNVLLDVLRQLQTIPSPSQVN